VGELDPVLDLARCEAQSTSALEGTYAPFAEVLAAEPEDQLHLSAEVREIFERMAELAFSWPEDRPMTIGMLGELQCTLVSGTAGELRDAAGLRDRIVVIGARGRGFGAARFVPPPPGDQLRAGVEALLSWINSPPNLPTVVQAALAHYQFETLHPYSDGNGRLGRLLVIVQLLRGAVIREPLLVVSPWFEQRRAEYQDALLDLSLSGDWDAWIAFFAEGVAASASQSQLKVERFAPDLVGRPYISAPEVAQRYGVSKQGAHNAIRSLAELGIVAEAGRRAWSNATVFVAREVVKVASS
jgi:Fic family protein